MISEILIARDTREVIAIRLEDKDEKWVKWTMPNEVDCLPFYNGAEPVFGRNNNGALILKENTFVAKPEYFGGME